uniref:Uncharacterized protein n=1 Tax=Moumouvirus sp. 'Monve' TaxID=1128131 RepID=H2ED43_9VIRU|nr:hypothetical protein mv_R111 [Moumouvirus Monve]
MYKDYFFQLFFNKYLLKIIEKNNV